MDTVLMIDIFVQCVKELWPMFLLFFIVCGVYTLIGKVVINPEESKPVRARYYDFNFNIDELCEHCTKSECPMNDGSLLGGNEQQSLPTVDEKRSVRVGDYKKDNVIVGFVKMTDREENIIEMMDREIMNEATKNVKPEILDGKR